MTVGLVIVSHSTQLAAGVAELAGQMAQGKTPIAVAGGAIDDLLGTSVDKILGAIKSVDGPDGVLVLVDLGSAILATEMVLELLDDDQRDRICLSFAPLVEGAVAAALEASLGNVLTQVQQAAERTASSEQLKLLKPVTQTEVTPTPTIGSVAEQATPAPKTGTKEVQLQLINPMGLHARPASLFVQTAGRFQARIQVLGRGREADATSIIGVLSLGVQQGDTIIIRASGTDANTAIAALEELVRASFYETTPLAGMPAPTVVRDAAAQPSMATSPAAQEAWQGVTTSAGVAVGPALLYTSGNFTLSVVERHPILPNAIVSEQHRLRESLAAAAQELDALALSLQDRIGRAQADIFNAQALMLRDPDLIGFALRVIEEQHIDAASALAATGEHYAATLEALDNPVLAARGVDMRDAISRAIQRLSDQKVRSFQPDDRAAVDAPASFLAAFQESPPKQDLSSLSQPVIVVANDLTPSDTALLRPATVLGICTVQGGPTAHAAILSRALGIPAIAGLSEAALQVIHAGDELGLDADNGLLYHHPLPEVRAALVERHSKQQQQRALVKQAIQQGLTPINIDGRRIHLLANIASEAEAEAARQWGAEGVGLLRTEFLFADASILPGENEQRQRYVQVFRAFGGDLPGQAGPLVVRTLDAGADKPMPALNTILGAIAEANPALGLRGIRIHLAHQALLEQQLTALLLAAADTGIQLHIMFPMISTVEELQIARSIFDRIYERLKSRQIALPAHVPLGIMVEVPAAVIMASELAEFADFFSIGANDLLQYTLASDRTNPSVSSLYHPMQPAVLRLIRQVAEAGRRAGKKVAVCGEIASDVQLAPLLVGLGVDELSMVPTAIPAVRTALMGWSSKELSHMAESILHLKTVAEVEQACTDFTNVR
jgi:phosphoenolpyruvate-protein phosphotransferase/dihydroxyacetone kinase phosphotransfer subunit